MKKVKDVKFFSILKSGLNDVGVIKIVCVYVYVEDLCVKVMIN